jgi:hypothetical protein
VFFFVLVGCVLCFVWALCVILRILILPKMVGILWLYNSKELWCSGLKITTNEQQYALWQNLFQEVNTQLVMNFHTICRTRTLVAVFKELTTWSWLELVSKPHIILLLVGLFSCCPSIRELFNLSIFLTKIVKHLSPMYTQFYLV